MLCLSSSSTIASKCPQVTISFQETDLNLFKETERLILYKKGNVRFSMVPLNSIV